MPFVYTIFLVVLSVTSYATGAVVARRSLKFRASSLICSPEVFIVVAALAIVFSLRPAHHSIQFLLVCGAALWLLGAGVSIATRTARKAGCGGTREFEEIAPVRSSVGIWKRWQTFSRSVADYQIRLVLVASYLLLIAPIAVASRLFRRDLPHGKSSTTWSPRSDAPSLDSARKPF